MKAMIFAAGLGTRLKPLTNHIPKALLEVNGITLLEVVILRLKFYGIKDIVINTHHFAEKIISFIEQKNSFGINIHFSDETDKILETGGGLKKASHYFMDDTFLVCNADVMTDLDIHKMVAFHKKYKPIATIAVQNRKTSRYFLFDENQNLCGWQNVNTNEQILTQDIQIENTRSLAFSTTHIIEPRIFKYFPDKDFFSMVELYLTTSQTEIVKGYDHTGDILFDVGKIEELDKASEAVKNVLNSLKH
jgi:NDP-sugar pyrophosphorylase family protein